jgi:hypothetical protein
MIPLTVLFIILLAGLVYAASATGWQFNVLAIPIMEHSPMGWPTGFL